MKWFSHRIFAVGMAAVCKFDFIGIGAAYLGSTVPDSIDFFLTKLGADFNKIHRRHSHAWVWYALALALLHYAAYPFLSRNLPWLLQYKEYIAAFFLGIFSHIFLDMLTIKGVPLFLDTDKKIAFKLVRTNRFSESVFIFVFFVAAGLYLYATKNPYVADFINLVMRQL